MPKSNFIQKHASQTLLYVRISRGFFSVGFSWLQLEYDIKSCRLRCWCVFAYIKKSLSQNMWNKNFFYYNTKISPEICTNSCRLMGFSITCETKYNSSHSLSKDLLFLFLSGRKQIFPMREYATVRTTIYWSKYVRMRNTNPYTDFLSRYKPVLTLYFAVSCKFNQNVFGF